MNAGAHGMKMMSLLAALSLSLLGGESLAWSTPPATGTTALRNRGVASRTASIGGIRFSSRRSRQPASGERTKATCGWSLRRDNADESDGERQEGLSDAVPLSSVPTRRQWIQQLASGASSSAMYWSLQSPSIAAAASSSPPSAALVVATPATCDPTVSVWRRDNRLVYLLGTAHISQISAELAGQLVRDVHPDAVFIELDLKRVGGLASGTNPAKKRSSLPAVRTSTVDLGLGDDEVADGSSPPAPPVPASRLLVPAVTSSPALPASSSPPSGALGLPDESTAAAAVVATSARPPPFGLDVGAAAVGNAIRGMYQNLNQAGFRPGDEFVEAVKEGRKIGADIVLGDRDVQVTLRRLVQALQVTDLQKLMDPNSELEQSMRELLPSGGGGGALPGGYPATYKDEVTAFVEAIKTRDRVRTIMKQLGDVAPALVQVMLTERDAYMAAGLDSLNQYTVIVAVMGIAHQDGVERNLQSVGWKQVQPPCRRRGMTAA